jgi:hypothetical protein
MGVLCLHKKLSTFSRNSKRVRAGRKRSRKEEMCVWVSAMTHCLDWVFFMPTIGAIGTDTITLAVNLAVSLADD